MNKILLIETSYSNYFKINFCLLIYIYIYIYMCVCVCVYIYKDAKQIYLIFYSFYKKKY
jgi:hypothetical protein